MIKKLSALFLSLCMIMSLAVVSVSAVEDDPTEEPVVATVYDDNGETNYSTLESALSAVTTSGFVYLMDDYTLASDAIVPSDVTLVIPLSAEDEGSVVGDNNSGAVVSGEAYVTLTVPSEKNLVVNGTLIVSGNQQSSQPKTGCLTGDYGKIYLDGGNLTVNGELYARGEISGTGTVTANSSSKVYQMFQIQDWRGGSKALSAYNNGVFPFSLYEIKNITAKTIYKNGAVLRAQYYIYAGGTGVEEDMIIIGPDGQFDFIGASTTSGEITFTRSNDVTTVQVGGAVKTGDMQVSLKQYGFTFPISSAGKICPFGYNMNVQILNGGSLEITNDLKFLPGCEVTVLNGGSLTVDEGKGVYFYGTSGYSSTYNFASWTSAAAAKLINNGTVTNNGTIASTDATFANVTGYTAAQTAEGTNVTVTVNEYVQATGVAPVTFTVGTPAAPSVEE